MLHKMKPDSIVFLLHLMLHQHSFPCYTEHLFPQGLPITMGLQNTHTSKLINAILQGGGAHIPRSPKIVSNISHTPEKRSLDPEE